MKGKTCRFLTTSALALTLSLTLVFPCLQTTARANKHGAAGESTGQDSSTKIKLPFGFGLNRRSANATSPLQDRPQSAGLPEVLNPSGALSVALMTNLDRVAIPIGDPTLIAD
jgi:hypothetical protein